MERPATARESGKEWPLSPPAICAPTRASHGQTQLEAPWEGCPDDIVHRGQLPSAQSKAEISIESMGKEKGARSFFNEFISMSQPYCTT